MPVRVTEDEHARYTRAAQDSGITLSEWIRHACDRAAVHIPTLAERVTQLEDRVKTLERGAL